MKLYADRPRRRAGQMVADVVLLVWALAWLWAALTVHDVVSGLAGPGERARDAAASLAASLREAGGVVGSVPMIGESASAPFGQGAEAADAMAAAAERQRQAVADLAFWLALGVGVLPVTLAAVAYLPGRFRFVREATAAQGFLGTATGPDLFALRALAHQPLHRLAAIHADPAGAWRAGDPRVVTELAVLEMRACGLEPRLRAPG